MKKYLVIGLFSFLCIFSLFSCFELEEDDDGNTSITPTDPNAQLALKLASLVYNTYMGSASYGDLVTFELDKEELTYVLNNETTDQSEEGTFKVLDQDLAGLYHLESGTEDYFAVELSEKIAVSTFPSGRSQNDLIFGVTSEEEDTSLDIANIPGDYVYVRLGEYEGYGGPDFKEYGVFTLTPSGEIHLYYTATGGPKFYGDLEDIATDVGFPVTSDKADYSGTWNVGGSQNNRFQVNLIDSDNVGYAYADNQTAVFLLDLGTGQGSAIAYKISNTSLGQLSGNYKFVSIDNEGGKFAGVYSLSSSGAISYAMTDDGERVYDDGSFQIEPLQGYGNIFEGEIDGTYITFVAVGEVMMFFQTDEDGRLIGYGAGATI